MTIPEVIQPSKAMVVYKPQENLRSILERRVAEIYWKCFERAKYESVHLPQFGTNRIFVLLGQSTAGKTSIINELENTIPGAINLGLDIEFPLLNAELIQEHEPALYERMAKALDPQNISSAVFWNTEADRLCWKKGISEDLRADALQAIEEARKKLKSAHIEPLPFEVMERRQMDHVIDESQQRPLVAFDPWLNALQFMRHCAIRNFSTPVRIGLAYCPFTELPARVAARNAQALGIDGDPNEWRHPIGPIMQFIEYYRPAEKGETVIDVLVRSEVENAFENAFHQELSYLSARSAKDSESQRLCEMLTHDHDQMKSEVMMRLGFTRANIETVGITPQFQGFQYLFNTKVMKPSASADIIRDWR